MDGRATPTIETSSASRHSAPPGTNKIPHSRGVQDPGARLAGAAAGQGGGESMISHDVLAFHGMGPVPGRRRICRLSFAGHLSSGGGELMTPTVSRQPGGRLSSGYSGFPGGPGLSKILAAGPAAASRRIRPGSRAADLAAKGARSVEERCDQLSRWPYRRPVLYFTVRPGRARRRCPGPVRCIARAAPGPGSRVRSSGGSGRAARPTRPAVRWRPG